MQTGQPSLEANIWFASAAATIAIPQAISLGKPGAQRDFSVGLMLDPDLLLSASLAAFVGPNLTPDPDTGLGKMEQGPDHAGRPADRRSPGWARGGTDHAVASIRGFDEVGCCGHRGLPEEV